MDHSTQHAKNSTNFCFWIARGLTNKREMLEEFLYQQNIEICGISETKYLPNRTQTFKQYNLFHKSNPNGNGGAAILARRNLQYNVINLQLLNHYPDVIAITFLTQANKTITIINIYSPPNEDITKQMIENIVNQVVTTTNSLNNIIIGGGLQRPPSHMWIQPNNKERKGSSRLYQ
jgi:exonuclease III